ncbi:hypothetical protein IQ247_14785 [Plectonema cf. radiosum LEGE 06105]|uniref:Uncharacterized protein n=1 Tax=Plectonema cf. radiosum LEGE 06105 TaxID=945769 RepID=A0A8J7K0P8_9CYAN|nr:hypothetical protein [Plectonema radiosum]MBE9213916.1 hypothetical protein [Plectonema cf. radiosum LEGE 06105]
MVHCIKFDGQRARYNQRSRSVAGASERARRMPLRGIPKSLLMASERDARTTNI